MLYIYIFCGCCFLIIPLAFFFFFFFSLILCFWNSNLYTRFLIFAFWYLLSILYIYKPKLQYPILPESEITGLTTLSSLGLSFFSKRWPLSLCYPFSSLPNSESLCVPDSGEHLGNWLLAGSVSLLFISLFYPPGRLIYFLPLLFPV